MAATTTKQTSVKTSTHHAGTYENWIKEIAEAEKTAKQQPRLQILSSFLSIKLNPPFVREHISIPTMKQKGNTKASSTKSNSSIVLLRFQSDGVPLKPIPISENKLQAELESGAESQLYIVQDLSPVALKLFGDHWNVDPQFFLDYLDLMPCKAKTGASHERLVKPTPWYRLGNVAYHLPPLSASNADAEHVVIRYIGPREYRPAKNDRLPVPWAPDRFEPDLRSTHVERVGGGHNPISADVGSFWKNPFSSLRKSSGSPSNDNTKLWPVALIRHSAAVWFGKESSGQWKRGIILLDEPFKSTKKEEWWEGWTRALAGRKETRPENELTPYNSTYRQFSSLPLPLDKPKYSVDERVSYASSLLHCLLVRTDGKKGVPSPSFFLHEVCKIIASEWIVTNAYLERDLNSIEWRLEQSTPNLHALEFFLNQLFIMRRRIRKYQSSVNAQLQLKLPSYWDKFVPTSKSPGADSDFSTAINDNFLQVQELINRNDDRIKDTVELMTSVMSVLEGKKSNTQNQGLFFLTFVATVALPFNVSAAIFGMGNNNNPSNPDGWEGVKKVSMIIVAVTSVCYVLMFTGFWIKNLLTRASAR